MDLFNTLFPQAADEELEKKGGAPTPVPSLGSVVPTVPVPQMLQPAPAPEQKAESAYRTIGEAASELGLEAHVLRFWETQFSQIQPMKRSNGRRYYKADDLALLKGIKKLLHDKGYTIKGVQKALEDGTFDVEVADGKAPIIVKSPAPRKKELVVKTLSDKQAVLDELIRIRATLAGEG